MRRLLLASVVSLLLPERALAATVTGTITVAPPSNGARAAPLIVEAHVGRDGHVCGLGGPVLARAVRADERGRLAEALVFIESASATAAGALKGARSSQVITVDQKNCTFSPRVAATAPGAKVRFTSSDPVLHHVRATLGERVIANLVLPIQGQTVDAFVAKEPGMIAFRCDPHPWMGAHLWVLPHTYWALTGAGGRYRIEGLPRGSYRLVAWHPDLGSSEARLRVDGSDRVVELDLALPMPAR